MASLSKPAHPISSTSACTSRKPNRHFRHLLPSIRSHLLPRISCGRPPVEQSGASTAGQRLDRRNVLLGLAGLYGLATDRRALSLPIQAPDISTCGPAGIPLESGPSYSFCCPPYSSTTTVIDFKPPPASSPLRVRLAAQLVDPACLAKYKKAVELMKALPADDPRNFTQQANVHCAYCDGAYDQVGFPGLDLEIHKSWLFFPWHRLYLYFHERILGKLIGDDTFALPFWNWDNPEGMIMPAIYTDPNSPLYDPFRNQHHLPPTLVDLDYNGADRPIPIPPKCQIDINLYIMYRQVFSQGKTAKLFLGKPYRRGQLPNPGAGNLEIVPHNTVHDWTGDSREPKGEDMGVLYAAARDPIFFAHHGNVDRIWTVWRQYHQDFTDTDWLDAGFLFYDENKQLVRVKVRDCLDTKKLGYEYQEVPNLWIQTPPTPKKVAATKEAIKEETFPVDLESVAVNKTLKRATEREKTGKEEEEVLVVEGIELDWDEFVKFDVYINCPEYQGVGPEWSQFAGSFVNLPHMKGHRKKSAKMETALRLGISDLMKDLNAENDDRLLITIVPRKGKVRIGGCRLEYSVI